MSTLPYVTATGNIERALSGVKQAATPISVSQDFVKTILNIPGGSGNQITSFLRKIGFVGPDGAPTTIYTRFRSTDPDTSGKAAAEALKIGYAALYKRNEYMHQLSDDKLKGLIIEETGLGGDSGVPGLILSCIKAIKKHASFSPKQAAVSESLDIANSHNDESNANAKNSLSSTPTENTISQEKNIGLNLSYTINLNLPATSDIAVFNAIFKSLKENLLKGNNE
ncbi:MULTISPECIES: DUF5343 domain-containing protein [unclassified Brenneria]|uniref:DUF5343 domain-containing protein n=1 Tax=unclassified Brenneria TaxID=2634434 RepID=UPI001551D34C|nr:DUF5343 domain-containing protein [Brenneria sp. HEZEL_4_2_4]NPD00084.1 DUF5343 domain-containing protein [Brenneria sp. hezel4-2-4]